MADDKEIKKQNFWTSALGLFRRVKKEVSEENPQIVVDKKTEIRENLEKMSKRLSSLEKRIAQVHYKEEYTFVVQKDLAQKATQAKNKKEKRTIEGKIWEEKQKRYSLNTEKENLFEQLYEANRQISEGEANLLSLDSREIILEHNLEKEEMLLPKSKKTEVLQEGEEAVNSSVSSGLGISVDDKLLSRKRILYRDLLFLALRTFRVKLGMTMLTIMGIGVSFATIFFLVSFGYGIEKVMLDQFASEILLRTVDVISPNNEITPLTPAFKEKISLLPGVEYVEPVFGLPGQIETGSRAAEVQLRGAGIKYFELFGGNLKEGRSFREGERSVVLSGSFLQTMNKNSLADFTEPLVISAYPEKLVGGVKTTQTANLGEFSVVGIDNDMDNSFVYLSPSLVSDLVTQYAALKVLAKSDAEIINIRSAVSDMGFITSSVVDTVDQAIKVFSILEIILALFGAASLIVATIGMVNTMTVSLLERTQEIGVMKVLGVSSGDVRKLFLLEASIIGGLGGLFGIFCGVVFSQGFNLIINILAKNLGGKPVSLFYYPLWFVLSIAGASLIIGLLTGFVPAQRAANMDPLMAVKYK